MNHEVERVDNLMYKGCEPHWKCKHCGTCIPFHCGNKEYAESQECREDEKKDPYYNPFPSRLRLLLSRKGETQTKLAESIGVHRQSIAQWKDGATVPDINALYKIAEYYNISTEYLLGRVDELDGMSIESLEEERNSLKYEIVKLRKAIQDINEILDTFSDYGEVV
jgi:transcriptional regulator with XRE-family HTH domain